MIFLNYHLIIEWIYHDKKKAAIPNLDGVQAHDHDAAPHVGQGVNGLESVTKKSTETSPTPGKNGGFMPTNRGI